MGTRVAVEFDLKSLGDQELLRLIRWCNERGATEFTVTAAGWGGDGRSVDALGRRIRASLEGFAVGEDERRYPTFCMWKVRKVQLWRLSPESIEALSSLQVGTRVAAGAGTDHRERPAGIPEPWAAVHHLCLYRDGKPMLGLFEEQGASVTVVVRHDELTELRKQGFGPETDSYDNYFADYYG